MSDYLKNLIDDLKYCQHTLMVVSDLQPTHAPSTRGVLHEMGNLMGVHINHLQTIADYQQSSSECTTSPQRAFNSIGGKV